MSAATVPAARPTALATPLAAAARGLAAIAGIAAFLLGTAGPAAAHAYLVSSSPAAGAVLRTAPRTVSVTFDEVVHSSFAVLAVTGPDGRRLDSGTPQVLDATVRQAVAPLPAAGSYTVSYRVVSSDGHPVTAALHFRFAPPAGYHPAASGLTVNGTAKPGGGTSWFGVHGTQLLVLLLVVLAAGGTLAVDRRRQA